MKKLRNAAYALYTWLIFVPCVSVAILCACLVPGLERRRRWVTACGRGFFALAGIRCTVTGTNRLPTSQCVVVANHASYLDGVILQSYLPPRFSYVIKGEVRKVPVLHFCLRRIGAHFVERHSATGSSRDARVLVRAAGSGESLAFFPEGTFVAEPGLGRFRPGAFVAAKKSSAPVVPVVIRGSRQILPAGTLLPAHGHLQIDILQPVASGGDDVTTQALATEARRRMLPILGEPDLLAPEPPM